MNPENSGHLSEAELHLRMTGEPLYGFTPITNEPELRAAIGNVSWREHGRFGAEFSTLTTGMPDAKETLVRIALDPAEPTHLHSHAMCALSKIGDREAVEALTGVIFDPRFDGHVRYHAAGWIACIQSRDAVLALERVIFDPELPLTAKRGAVRGMDCWSHEHEATRVLLRVREDRKLFPQVRDCFGQSLHREWPET